MTAQSGVTATCTVHTVYNVKVSWLLNGTVSPSDDVVNRARSTVSRVTVPLRQWRTLHDVTCKAEHRCFATAEKTIRVAGERSIQNEKTFKNI